MKGSRIIFLFFILVGLCNLFNPSLCAQNMDSLHAIVDGQKGKERAKTLLEIAYYRDSEEDYQKAYYFSKTEGFSSEQIQAAISYGYYLWEEKGFSDEGRKLSKEAQSIAISIRDTIGWIDALLLDYHILFFTKDYHLSIQPAIKALELAKAIQDTFSVISTHLALADGYSNFSGNQFKSKDNLLRALEYLPLGKMQESRYKIYNDLGSYYNTNQKSDSALFYYRKALEVGQQYLHPEDQAIVLTNIALVFYELDSLNQANNLVDSALQLNYKARDTSGLSYDHYVLSKIREKEGEIKLALMHAHKAQKFARTTMHDFDLLNAYERLHEVYLKTNDIYNHNRYLKSYYLLKDSINMKERRVFNQNFEARLAAERNNAKILKLNQQAWRSQRMQWALWLALLTLALISMLIYNSLQNRGKAQKAKLQQLQAQRIAHRLELENAHAKKELHEEQIKIKERELASKMTQSIQQREVMTEVLDKLNNLVHRYPGKESHDIQALMRKIERENQMSDSWPDLIMHFEKARPQFFDRIKKQGVSLTPNEERLCVYAFMRLDTSTTSQLMGINNESVNKARYRLRKKFQLSKEQKLEDFITSLMQSKY